MTRKKRAFTMPDNFTPAVSTPSESTAPVITIDRALAIVTDRMRQEGMRPRTISDYNTHVAAYAKTANIGDLSDVTEESVYLYLSSLKVADSTKLIRLKCIRAFFERCHRIGWLTDPFWRNISIRVSTPIKEGTSERDINFVLSTLDMTDFSEYRDAVAIMLLYQTGIRVSTAANLRNKHVNTTDGQLELSGDIIKNHNAIILPISGELSSMLSVLMRQNDEVRRHNMVRNDYVFITTRGGYSLSNPPNNNIARRINEYRKRYNLRNFSAHAIRRAYAKSLYKRSGRDITLVSKALGHSDLSVTTRYLHIDAEEVADSLRKYID